MRQEGQGVLKLRPPSPGDIQQHTEIMIEQDMAGAQDTIYLCNFRVSVDGEWLCLKELQDVEYTMQETLRSPSPPQLALSGIKNNKQHDHLCKQQQNELSELCDILPQCPSSIQHFSLCLYCLYCL